MIGAAALVLHALLLLAAAPVLAGLLAPPVVQTWRDWRRLLRKQPLRTVPGPSWAPPCCVAPLLAAALLVPSFALGTATAPLSDLLVVAGLLALSRAVLALAAYEAALPAPEAERGLLLRAALEPGLLALVTVVALLAGSSNLDAAGAALRDGSWGWRGGLVLAVLGTAVLGFADAQAGIPALNWSGRDLVLLRAAQALRLLVWLSLLALLFLPFGMAPAEAGPQAWAIGAACWALKIGALALLLDGVRRLAPHLDAVGLAEMSGLALLLLLAACALLAAMQGGA